MDFDGEEDYPSPQRRHLTQETQETTMFGWFKRRSTLKLCYVIMSKESRFWIQEQCWGGEDGRDMCDAMIFFSKRDAERTLAGLDKPGSVFEIGLHNGKPVMLVDAYSYWLDANYSKAKKT